MALIVQNIFSNAFLNFKVLYISSKFYTEGTTGS